MGSYVDRTVAPGAAYTYDIDARNSAGASPPTAPVGIQVPLSGPRNRLLSPFPADAWPNYPAGSGQVTVAARLAARTAGVKPQEIPMGSDPNQAVTEFFRNAGQTGDRCAALGPFTPPISVPFNSRLIVPSASDNYPPAFVGGDANTRWEGGNFGHCTGLPPCAGHFGAFGTLDDDAVGGGSGGSGLSTWAGTIRYGEFTHGSFGDKVLVAGSLVPAIRHVLRIDLCVSDLSSYSAAGVPGAGPGFRWPADRADSGYNDPKNANYYSSPVWQCVEGSLLVIPMGVNLGALGLTTIPGKQLAWTAQNYGMRSANTQHNLVWAICTEWSVSSAGVQQRVAAADGVSACEFTSLYGFSMVAKPTTAFGRDMNIVIQTLAVIGNDAATNIGGGGVPLQPFAAPLAA